jgi:hypothetical protein
MSAEGFAQQVPRLGFSPDFSSGSCSTFFQRVVNEERRIDYLLACPGPVTGWFRRRRQTAAEKAEVKLTLDVVDPEFRKNLRIVRRLISDAAEQCVRAECRPFGSDPELARRNVTFRIKELEERIHLPSDRPLTLKVLLGFRFTLEQLLIDIGDEVYVGSRAAALYAEDEGSVVTWKELFDSRTPPLMVANISDERRQHEEHTQRDRLELTRTMVAHLLAAKEADDMPIRARRELKQAAFFWVAPLFVIAAAFLAHAIARESIPVFLPAVSGMTGAALGMLFKLRDELKLGSQIREFLPFAVAQLMVGITAGLFVSMIEGSDVVNLVESAGGVGVISFVVGYSEAAFLGLVGNIAKTTRSAGSGSLAAR